MTAHELARKLLSMEDLKVCIREPAMDDYTVVVVNLVEYNKVYTSKFGMMYEYSMTTCVEEKAIFIY